MKKSSAALGTFAFFWVAPALVACYVPWTITRWRLQSPFPGGAAVGWIGAALIVAGAVALVECFVRFAIKGRGTPAPIAPTESLVVSGLYRYVRNPMYVGVLAVVVGQAMVFGSAPLLAYAAFLWGLTTTFVMLYEEPELTRQFGQEYVAYRASVRRWWPRLSPVASSPAPALRDDRPRAISREPLPAVRLVPQPAGPSAGASHLGGRPSVGPGFEWPHWKGRPLSFLLQVDLAAVARFPFAAAALPTRGLLLFFYDPEQETWGFDPKDKGSWLVHHEPDTAAVEPRKPPESMPDSGLYAEIPLDAVEVETLTPDEEPDEDEAHRHQLLGHPGIIQDEMYLQCEMVTSGLYTGDATAYGDPRVDGMKARAGRWRLLAQIDGDDDAGMMWGDCGRLYFWITDEALARRAFHECWMILQCS